MQLSQSGQVGQRLQVLDEETEPLQEASVHVRWGRCLSTAQQLSSTSSDTGICLLDYPHPELEDRR